MTRQQRIVLFIFLVISHIDTTKKYQVVAITTTYQFSFYDYKVKIVPTMSLIPVQLKSEENEGKIVACCYKRLYCE
jgi:hypothetical protein